MKRWIKRLSIILALWPVLGGFETVYAANSDSPNMAVWIAANKYRELEGLRPFTLDTSLNLAAKHHSQYMSLHADQIDHQETDKTSPAFTGTWPTDRIQTAGYLKSYSTLYENLEMGFSPIKGVSDLFASPYHRYAFLDPSVSKLGIGISSLPASNGYEASPLLTMELIANQQYAAAPVVSPAPHQINVPVAWTDYEDPDPLRFISDTESAPVTLGYPIVVFLPSPETDAVLSSYSIEKMELTDSTGQVLPAYLNTVENGDTEADQGPILMPKSPLQYNSTYTVTLTGKETIQTTNYVTKQIPLHLVWSFQTVEKPMNPQTVNVIVNGKLMDESFNPAVIDGHSYLPIEKLTDLLGLHVIWNADTKTAAIFQGKTVITLSEASSLVGKNNQTTTLPLPLKIQDHQLLVPLREIGQVFNDQIGWDEITQTIFIHTPKQMPAQSPDGQ